MQVTEQGGEGAALSLSEPAGLSSGTWTKKMASYLQRLNELTLPQAAQLATANLELHLYQDKDHDKSASKPAPADKLKEIVTSLPISPNQSTALARLAGKPAHLHALKHVAVNALAALHCRDCSTRAAAMARVEKALESVNKKVGGLKPSSFFQDAMQNLAGASKRAAHLHLKGRTMMLADYDSEENVGANEAGGEDSRAPNTASAIEEAMADEGMEAQQKQGDTLKGTWHAPMWVEGSDEGSPVLTSTIAAPGQGGEYTYGFPVDEAKLFSLAMPSSNGNASNDAVENVSAAEEEHGARFPFYEGVGAGGKWGPAGEGGWDGSGMPPPMPGHALLQQFLKKRANGYSDEFEEAAKGLRAKTREEAVKTRSEATLSHDTALRNKMAAFVTAFDQKRGGEERVDAAALDKGAGVKEVGTVGSESLAPASAPKPTHSLPDRDAQAVPHSDADFLGKFKGNTVDEGEDVGCGWPGPACADALGDSPLRGGAFEESIRGADVYKYYAGMQDGFAGKAVDKPPELKLARASGGGSRSGERGLTELGGERGLTQLAASLRQPLHFSGR